MKHSTILILGTVTLLSQACQQKNEETKQAVAEVAKTEVNENPNQVVFENLDRVLSPFEDMTEFALDKNEEGINKSLEKVEAVLKEGMFEKNLTAEGMKSFSTHVDKLKELIKQKKYDQVALASSDIFESNTSNFVDANKIENQIRIEHLDYMGFKILSLLNQEKIDWQLVQQTTANVKTVWASLSPEIKDNNLKDSFEYLFEGLETAAKNKDIKIGEILASMDLSLVDVLENSI